MIIIPVVLKRPSQGFERTWEEWYLFQGNRGTRANFEGSRGPKTILGNRECKNGEQGNKPIFFRETNEQVPPPPFSGRASLKYCFLFNAVLIRIDKQKALKRGCTHNI